MIVGAVAIGRNEGERLHQCLHSLRRDTSRIVYVDSGSTDGSVALAESLGVDVVNLDTSIPFTAARARNAGFARLIEQYDVEAVLFVDGDCEVVAGWIEKATAELALNDRLAVACGRRRERHPQASIYNLLCDMEWNTLPGDAKSCGGDALFRRSAFVEAGSYDDSLIAGEEPELCVRLRAKGWKVRRVDAEMTLHDAAMTRFSQWWRRAVRAGHAYAEGAAMHGRGPDRHCVRETRSIWLWGLVLPAAAAILAWPTHGLSLLVWLAYPLLVVRATLRRRASHGDPWRHAFLFAASCIVAKFPLLVGQCRYWKNRWLGRRSTLIEYKGPANAGLQTGA